MNELLLGAAILSYLVSPAAFALGLFMAYTAGAKVKAYNYAEAGMYAAAAFGLILAATV